MTIDTIDYSMHFEYKFFTLSVKQKQIELIRVIPLLPKVSNAREKKYLDF